MHAQRFKRDDLPEVTPRDRDAERRTSKHLGTAVQDPVGQLPGGVNRDASMHGTVRARQLQLFEIGVEQACRTQAHHECPLPGYESLSLAQCMLPVGVGGVVHQKNHLAKRKIPCFHGTRWETPDAFLKASRLATYQR